MKYVVAAAGSLAAGSVALLAIGYGWPSQSLHGAVAGMVIMLAMRAAWDIGLNERSR